MNGREIRESITCGQLSVDPFDPSLIQPNSLDVRLGDTECSYVAPGFSPYVDLANEAPQSVSRQVDKVVLKPGKFLLVETMEYFKLPSTIYGLVLGKSSTGRLGIDVENAGLVDSGFEGSLTLELYNKSFTTYSIPVGFPIAQVIFFQCSEVETPYSQLSTARYNGQRGATPYRKQTYDTAHKDSGNEDQGTTSPVRFNMDFFSGKSSKRHRKDGSGRNDS